MAPKRVDERIVPVYSTKWTFQDCFLKPHGNTLALKASFVFGTNNGIFSSHTGLLPPPTPSFVLVEREHGPEHKANCMFLCPHSDDACRFNSSPQQLWDGWVPWACVLPCLPQLSAAPPAPPRAMLTVGARWVGRVWGSHSPGTGLSPGCRCSPAAALSAHLCGA